METLKNIYLQVEDCAESNHREERVTCYINTLKKYVNNNKNILLAYKEECKAKTDLNVPTFWMSSNAIVVALLSLGVTTLGISKIDVLKGLLLFLLAVAIFITVMIGIYYRYAYKDQKNYRMMMIAIEEIEREMNNP